MVSVPKPPVPPAPDGHYRELVKDKHRAVRLVQDRPAGWEWALECLLARWQGADRAEVLATVELARRRAE